MDQPKIMTEEELEQRMREKAHKDLEKRLKEQKDNQEDYILK